MDKKGIEKDTEYSALRQEILNLITIQNTYIIAMYTITITILGIGIERKSSILLLLPYVILFSFQRIIAAKKDSYLRVAAYIAVYLEDGDGWEWRYKKISENTIGIQKANKKKFVIKDIISGRISSLQLGLLCSSMSIGMCLIENCKKILTMSNLTIVILSIALFVSLCYFCKDTLETMKKRDNYIQIMFKCKQME
ncbi:hypothetical protein [Blautia wexlerae]|uniref:hypothetical protein n=1 Tax=Blautia wexlerae TaxID=418240 RepID=UPI00156E080A|nr:hypothetical protein [Blautia wexlerae]NSF39953.1 hypothetical protein [Blautia wexlerae]